MKKFFVALFAFAAMFVFVGCSDSPKDVVKKWTDALREGDLKKANAYTEEKAYPVNENMIKTLSSDNVISKKMKEEFEADVKNLKNAKEEIKGDEAKVFISGEKKPPLTLKKIDGKWKIVMK